MNLAGVKYSRCRAQLLLCCGLLFSVGSVAQSEPIVLSLETSFATAVPQSEGLVLTLGIQVGDKAGENADWFLIKSQGGEFSSFNIQTGDFENGIFPSQQLPLASVAAVRLGPLSVAPGTLEIYFGVDLTPDNMVNEESRSCG